MFIDIINNLSNINNEPIFAVSIVPYSIFLYFLCKNKRINNLIKVGFSLTILFVAITIGLSIYAEITYGKSLVDIDYLHGGAELFLTISDFIILFGMIKLLEELEMKNS